MVFKVVCYGEEKEYPNAKAAFDFYSQGAIECDGHEAERYQNVVACIIAGCNMAWDFNEVPRGYGKVLTSAYMNRVLARYEKVCASYGVA